MGFKNKFESRIPSGYSKFKVCNEQEIECHECKGKFFIFYGWMPDGNNVMLVCADDNCKSVEIVEKEARWGFCVRITKDVREELLTGIDKINT